MRLPPRFVPTVCLCIIASSAFSSPGSDETSQELAVASPAPASTNTGGTVSSAASGKLDFSEFELPEAKQTPDAFSFNGTYVSGWPPSAARNISLNESNTFPYLIPDTKPFEEGVYAWDAWPVRTPDGGVAVIDDWVVMVGLSSETDANSDFPFFTRSTWRYWYTRNGEWTPGGVIFERTKALGSRQWAGSTIYDPESNQITFYYTAVGALDAESLEADTPTRALSDGHPGAGRPNTEQRMAMVTASVSAGDTGVSFSDFGDHEMILEADGEIYVTEEAYIPGKVIYGMRDPHYWLDDKTGKEYILFTANAAGMPDPFNGVVGLAEKIDGTWTLQRPIIAAPGVSSQLERPHVITRDDGLYVFFSTHSFTFADGLDGPEGLYGFYTAEGDIRGTYSAMNGTGLVLGNPPAAPNQTYSYLVLPDGKVMSYVNTPYGYANDPKSGKKFIGAPAPLLQVGLKGGQSMLLAAPDTALAGSQ